MKMNMIAVTLLATTLVSGYTTAQETKGESLNSPLLSLKKQTRIIDGVKSEAGKYPFMTALISRNREQVSPFCGASFIGGRYVLTASHCLEGSNAGDLAVWIGGFDVNKPEGGKRVNVAQFYLHEEYDGVVINKDVAIVELVEEVEGATPIKLITPEIEATLQDGHVFTVMGWGNRNKNAQEQPDYPDELHEVNVPLYNRQTCEQNYTQEGETESGITEFMFCAGFAEGGKDSCQGDSGGPIVFQQNNEWYQAGVVSFGNGCAAPNSPGVYSRLSKFNEWVAQKRAGVSYLQTKRNGFVEQEFDEVVTFNIKNVGTSEFGVTAVDIMEQKNLANANITENLCDTNRLASGQSCNIQVKIVADKTGDASFEMKVTTDNTINPVVVLSYTMSSLEKETLDMPALVESEAKYVTWYGGGDANWQSQTTKVANGDSAIASGDIIDLQSSVLLATVNGKHVSKLNLKYLISSEEGYDEFQILHNNKSVLRDSGKSQTEFTDFSINLQEGVNRIAISYSKDQSESDGDDKAYLDSVTVENKNTAPEAKVKQATMTVEEGAKFTLDATDSTDADSDSMTYKWEQVGATSATIASSDTSSTEVTAPTVTADTDLNFKVTVSDEFGGKSEATVMVKVTNKAAPAPTPSPNKSSGGSFGWLLILCIAMLFAIRRKQTA